VTRKPNRSRVAVLVVKVTVVMVLKVVVAGDRDAYRVYD
jgi:hypothetical protein